MEYLKSIFLYQDDKPLLFTQLYFWGFFLVVLIFYSFLYKKKALRNAYLFLASLFFYYKTSGFFFFILLFSTFADFFIGQGIYKAQNKSTKKWLVALSVFINLFLLSYFKYAYLFADTLNYIIGIDYFHPINYFALWTNAIAGTHFEVDKILLPVGISFFTFQTISYSVDVYKEKIKPVTNILDFGFYVSFFPQLVAGPIVRAAEFIPQLYKDFKLTRKEFGIALFLILNGIMKKMFISDYISVNFVDRVFENPLTYTGFENLMALYGYSLQVYADFSGYTDIAIGVALLMGFRLPTNFNSPYKAQHVGEFWKRWHISLSTWLKDYLYIPIGGNRKGRFRTNVNLMITMLLGGLWHGASWQFVIWGGLNGVGLVIYKYWRKISPFSGNNHWIVRFYAIFLTFNFITFTRIWFRATSMERANNIMYKIANDWNFDLLPEMIASYKEVFIVMLIGFVVHWLPSSFKTKYKGWFVQSPIWVKALAVVSVVFIVYQVRSAELQPFIYFQF